MKNIHQLPIQASFLDLIGIPYKERDCYELVVLFYKKILNIELDILYDERPHRKQIPQLFNAQKQKFVKVDYPKFGDIIVINVIGLPCHIGIYIDSKMFLHTREKTGSVLERYGHWNKRIEGYYRCLKSE